MLLQLHYTTSVIRGKYTIYLVTGGQVVSGVGPERPLHVIRVLLLDAHQHGARISVEALLARVIADAANSVTHHLLVVNCSCRIGFATHQYHAIYSTTLCKKEESVLIEVGIRTTIPMQTIICN